MLARACISSIAYSRDLSWEQYDLWMTLPRLFGFVACLVIINRYGGLRLWGWHAGFSRRGLFLLALIVAAYIAHYASSVRLYHNTVAELWMGWATTVAVVYSRNHLFVDLCTSHFGKDTERLGRRHYPRCFLRYITGKRSLSASGRKSSLTAWSPVVRLSSARAWSGWPVAHAIIDGLWFHFGSGRGFQHPAYMTASFLCYIAALWLALRWILSLVKC